MISPQHQQVAYWMEAQHRTVRFGPMSKLPNRERVETVRFLDDAVQLVAGCLGVRTIGEFASAGQKDYNNVELLQQLTNLHAQVLAAYYVFGLADAALPALSELTNRTTPLGAGPAPHEPDFAKVLKTVYTQHTE